MVPPPLGWKARPDGPLSASPPPHLHCPCRTSGCLGRRLSYLSFFRWTVGVGVGSILLSFYYLKHSTYLLVSPYALIPSTHDCDHSTCLCIQRASLNAVVPCRPLNSGCKAASGLALTLECKCASERKNCRGPGSPSELRHEERPPSKDCSISASIYLHAPLACVMWLWHNLGDMSVITLRNSPYACAWRGSCAAGFPFK